MNFNYILVFSISTLLSIAFAYPVIKLLKKSKAKQTILHYVESHAGKSGTPTMGGIIFIFATIFSAFWFFEGEIIPAWLCLLVMFFYGLLGFLDDFIKIKFRQNEGLKPLQKIVGQVGISLILAVYIYLKVGTSLTFFNLTFDIGLFIIPFVVLVFLATSNSVNLIDGLDGLSSSVGLVYLLFFGLILTFFEGSANFAILCFAMVGGLFGFRLFNTYPAQIFMGDCGSLALGGFIASVACLTGLELLLPILGIMFVLTALSDIIQVLYFKKTRKRIFLMAPLHHHFEKKGVHENRIVAIYLFVTAMMGCICLGLMLVL